MHLFLYTAMASSIALVSVLIYLQSRRISRQPSRRDDSIFKYIFIDLLLAVLVMVFVSFIVPKFIWIIGNKEIGNAEIIRESRPIVLSSKAGENFYIREVSSGEKKVYSVQVTINKTKETLTFDASKAEIMEIKDKDKARYEMVAVYKINKLKSSGFISKAVNDIYANIYLQRDKAKFDSEKIRIFLPEKLIVRE